MVISADLLTEIERACGELQTRAADAARELRHRFSDLVVMHVDARDVQETPYRAGDGFDLHLLDVSGHCVRLVENPAAATGIVLAIHAKRP